MTKNGGQISCLAFLLLPQSEAFREHNGCIKETLYGVLSIRRCLRRRQSCGLDAVYCGESEFLRASIYCFGVLKRCPLNG
ncbi:hypothetical protein CEXT_263491 [Caerostris extrusa]|uniref:Secreted protein n=1 Tax=Caerostris extrusa TaxID=172846 RepID=A0AAV4SFS0_CAEEX|nr:hypothetical protein CEXT_263491 [Caerostris extrusa]